MFVVKTNNEVFPAVEILHRVRQEIGLPIPKTRSSGYRLRVKGSHADPRDPERPQDDNRIAMRMTILKERKGPIGLEKSRAQN